MNLDNLGILGSGDKASYLTSKLRQRVNADGGLMLDRASTEVQTREMIKKGIMDKASLVMIPGAGKAGKVYSMTPVGGTGDFSFTRGSVKWVRNKQGLYELVSSGFPAFEWSPSLSRYYYLTEPQRTNLINYPRAFTNAYWAKTGCTIEADPGTIGGELVINGNFNTDTDFAKGPGWTIANGVASYDASNNLVYISPLTPALTVGKYYRAAFTISSTARIAIADNTGSVLINYWVYPAGTYRFDFMSTGNNFRIYARNDGGGAFNLDNLSVKEIKGFNCPFLDSSNTVNAQHAFLLREDTSNGLHRVGNTIYGISSVPYTLTAFMKYHSRQYGYLFGYDGASSFGALFDLQNGVIGNLSNATATMNKLGDGWYKCSVTFTPSPIGGALSPLIGSSNTNSLGVYTGDGNSGILICHSQLEQGAYDTSPIFSVEGTTVTRLLDRLYTSETVSIPDISATVFVEINISHVFSGYERTVVDLYKDSSNYMQILFDSAGQIYTAVVSLGTLNAAIKKTGVLPAGRHKVAAVFASNNVNFFLDGVKVGNDNTSDFVIPQVLNLGSYSTGGQINLADGITTFLLFKSVLSDAECILLTTV